MCRKIPESPLNILDKANTADYISTKIMLAVVLSKNMELCPSDLSDFINVSLPTLPLSRCIDGKC